MEKLKELKGKFLAQYEMASSHTIWKYGKDLDYLFEGCKIKTLEDLHNFNELCLKNFYSFAKQMKWSVSTINSRLLTLKIFLKWCKKRNECNFESTEIKLARNDNRVHYTPPNNELDKFLSYINNPKRKSRLITMIKLLLNTGLRRFEICNLKIQDIDFKNSFITIKGKGNKTVRQPVKMEILAEVKEYIENERKETMQKYEKMGGKDLGYVFVSNLGNGGTKRPKDLNNGNQIKEHSFYNQIKKQAKKSGVEDAESWSTHAFRRKYVTTIYEKTGDVFLAQKAARHNSTDTTIRCYINFDQQRLKDIVDSL